MRPLARMISIAGHPVFTLPLISVMFLDLRGIAPDHLRLAFVVTAGCGCAVMLYSLVQQSRGTWTHVDASTGKDRQNLLDVLLLITAATFLALMVLDIARWVTVFSVGLFTMLFIMRLVRPALHVSLHVSFTALAIGLFYGQWVFMSVAVMMTLSMAWSRLSLERHNRVDVSVAMIFGIITGLLVFTMS